VIGAHTPSPKNFDALIFGYYEGHRLLYAARTRSGFTPATRSQLYRRFRPPEVSECPFVNLPEQRASRWGQRVTATKMRSCRWLKPLLVGSLGSSNGRRTATFGPQLLGGMLNYYYRPVAKRRNRERRPKPGGNKAKLLTGHSPETPVCFRGLERWRTPRWSSRSPRHLRQSR